MKTEEDKAQPSPAGKLEPPGAGQTIEGEVKDKTHS
jgi:hypothetical protein